MATTEWADGVRGRSDFDRVPDHVGEANRGWFRDLLDHANQRRDLARSRQVLEETTASFSRTDFFRALRLEVERTRRNGQPFALIQIEPRPRRNVRVDQFTDPIQNTLRVVDAMTNDPEQALVLLSGANAEAAHVVVERSKILLGIHAESLSWNVIVFPHDALTIGALLDLVYQGSTVMGTDRSR